MSETQIKPEPISQEEQETLSKPPMKFKRKYFWTILIVTLILASGFGVGYFTCTWGEFCFAPVTYGNSYVFHKRTCLDDRPEYCINRTSQINSYKMKGKTAFVPVNITEQYNNGDQDVIPGIGFSNQQARLLDEEEVQSIDDVDINQCPIVFVSDDDISNIKAPSNIDSVYLNAIADFLSESSQHRRLLVETGTEVDTEVLNALEELSNRQELVQYALDTQQRRLLQIIIGPGEMPEKTLFEFDQIYDTLDLYGLDLSVSGNSKAIKIENTEDQFNIKGQINFTTNGETYPYDYNYDLSPQASMETVTADSITVDVAKKSAKSCKPSFELTATIQPSHSLQGSVVGQKYQVDLNERYSVKLNGEIKKTNGKYMQIMKISDSQWLDLNVHEQLNVDLYALTNLPLVEYSKGNNLEIEKYLEKEIVEYIKLKVKVCVRIGWIKVSFWVTIKVKIEATIHIDQGKETILFGSTTTTIPTQQTSW